MKDIRKTLEEFCNWLNEEYKLDIQPDEDDVRRFLDRYLQSLKSEESGEEENNSFYCNSYDNDDLKCQEQCEICKEGPFIKL